VQGRIVVDGVALERLAARFGTPLYVYDAATVRAATRAYGEAFSRYGPALLGYSAKACALVGILALFRGAHLSAASLGEVEAAGAAGIPAARCWLHGNAKSDDELAGALRARVGRIVVDGEHEPERIARLLGRRRQDVWLRVSPEVVADTHTHLRTSGEQKFGIPLTNGRAAALARQIGAIRGLRLSGVHAHVGSQIRELLTFERVAASLASFARMLRAEGVPIEEVCVGGGLAAPQRSDEHAPDLLAYAHAVAHPIRALLPEATIVVEPGRALVARAGVAVYRVIERKELAAERVFLAVDGGMGDNIRPALYGARYEAALDGRADAPPEERVSVAGAYCEAGDVLIDEVALPRASVGDLVVVPAVGAYALAMASNYNHRPRPAVVLVDRGQAALIRRRERTSDLLRLERVASIGAPRRGRAL
jgi:diaminopimelate decarboxylase